MYSPYAPPAAPPPNHHGPYGQYGPTPFYRPLGGLTTAAAIAIVATVPIHLATNGLLMAIGPLPEDEGSLLAAFALLGAGLLTIAANLTAIILFLVWLHRAATNLRALGRQGLEFTPGWCVGWWFVPFAMLFKPFQAVKEVWQASDPDTVGANGAWAWKASPVASALGGWWAAWLVSCILDRISSKIDDTNASAAIGIVAALVSGLAAHLLVPIMRQLAARQEAGWAKLQSREAGMNPYDGHRAA